MSLLTFIYERPAHAATLIRENKFRIKPGIYKNLTPDDAVKIVRFALLYILPGVLKLALMLSPWQDGAVSWKVFAAMFNNPCVLCKTKKEKRVFLSQKIIFRKELNYTYEPWSVYFRVNRIDPFDLMRILKVLQYVHDSFPGRKVFDIPYFDCLHFVSIYEKTKLEAIQDRKYCECNGECELTQTWIRMEERFWKRFYKKFDAFCGQNRRSTVQRLMLINRLPLPNDMIYVVCLHFVKSMFE